jgi:PhzF family phenazine biosynthesis protein
VPCRKARTVAQLAAAAAKARRRSFAVESSREDFEPGVWTRYAFRAMKLKLYQIDAFTDRVFSGNPAGVCPLESWLPAETMQAIAAENNVAETAFFVKGSPHYGLRWFTPTVEIALCGHATLASAYVIMTELARDMTRISFETQSGVLGVARSGELYTLDFPSYPPKLVAPPSRLAAALGVTPVEVWQARQYMVLLNDESEVRAAHPDFSSYDWLNGIDVIITAAGDDCDFVSRFFAPNHGIPEDPVTGSTHCTLAPYWAKRLGKTRLRAKQLSPRGGELLCELAGDRVLIAGRCAKYLEGEISVGA